VAVDVVINHKVCAGKEVDAVRYNMLSKKLSARRFAEAVRCHSSIENRLQRQLEVKFGEDQSRIRIGRAHANFGSRRMSLRLLKNNHAQKLGVENKRLAARWDDEYLVLVMFGTCLVVQLPGLVLRPNFGVQTADLVTCG
jgi:predicted transposase YbfD/YdcC